MPPLAIGSLGLLLLAATPGRPQQPDTPEGLPSVPLPSGLERVLRDYERAWRARDPAALAELFAEDGFVLASGRPPMRGRAAIRAAYAQSGGPLVLWTLAFATEGSVGYIIGAYGHEPGSGDAGKFVLALRQGGDGWWLIAADIDNSIQRHVGGGEPWAENDSARGPRGGGPGSSPRVPPPAPGPPR